MLPFLPPLHTTSSPKLLLSFLLVAVIDVFETLICRLAASLLTFIALITLALTIILFHLVNVLDVVTLIFDELTLAAISILRAAAPPPRPHVVQAVAVYLAAALVFVGLTTALAGLSLAIVTLDLTT